MPLTIDGAGHRHLLISVADQPPLYVSDASGGWESAVVGSTHGGQAWDLRIDGQAHAHAFFVGASAANEPSHNRYASNAGGSWQDEIILNEAFGGVATLDAQGHPHLVYPGLQGMHHVTRGDDGWHDELLPLDAGLSVSGLAVDGAGHLHVAFSFQPRILYATNASGAWVTSTVLETSDSNAAYVANFALDANGQPTFAYDLANCLNQTNGDCSKPNQIGVIDTCK
jgi:hypothetical protein